MAIGYSKNPSKNRKVAKLSDDGKQALWPYVFATYRRVGDTCPLRCSFHPDHPEARLFDKSCYARRGRVPLHAQKATPDASDGDTVYRWVQGLPPGVSVRHHVSGDVYTDGALDWDYFERLCEAHEARPDVAGWLYTHAPFADWLAMAERAPANLGVNWSCDSLDEAREAQAAGHSGLTAVVAPDADRQRGVTICPQQTSGIPCAECKLCWNDTRKAIVGFLAH
jgi:hypothetical protein